MNDDIVQGMHGIASLSVSFYAYSYGRTGNTKRGLLFVVCDCREGATRKEGRPVPVP